MNEPTKDYKAAGFDELLSKATIVEDTTGVTRDEMVDQDKKTWNISDIRNFRIYTQGSVNMIAGQTTAEVSHDLGYAPTYLAYASPSVFATQGYYMIPFFENDGINNPRIAANATATKLQFLRTFGNGTMRIYYYIFREKAI